MKNARARSLLGMGAAMAVAGMANAVVVPVSNDITTATPQLTELPRGRAVTCACRAPRR